MRDKLSKYLRKKGDKTTVVDKKMCGIENVQNEAELNRFAAKIL